MSDILLDIPRKLDFLFKPKRYAVLYGGRGGSKSWAIAHALIAITHTQKKRVLCAREFQASMADSVHRLLKDRINAMGLADSFGVTQNSIYSKVTGSEFIFKGLKQNIQGIRSTEAADICWIEEAQSVSEESWQTLIPTIRTPGSEIWLSFNPMSDEDPTYKRFVLNPPPNAIVCKIGWEDNPWFSPELDAERRYMLETDPEAYEHVWGGETRRISEAMIFRGKLHVENFEEAPLKTRFYLGLDFGFSVDPTALVRCWVKPSAEGHGEDLMIDREAYAYNLEIDEMADFFDKKMPDVRMWPIKADNARPETISYLVRQGFTVSPAEKWQGSVEDGLAHIKGFRRVVVHERHCPHTARDFRLYSYKVDPHTKEVLPIIVDKHDHSVDAVRYSLDGLIMKRGGLGVWERLVRPNR